MKKYVFSTLLILSLIIFIMQNSFAQLDFPEGKWWKQAEILQNTDLTEDQIQKIENIYSESMKKIIEIEARFKIARLDLENLIENIEQEKLDINTLEKQIDLVTKLKGELEKERLMMLVRIRNLLSKETIAELKRLRGKYRTRWRERRKELLGGEKGNGPMFGNPEKSGQLE